MAISVSGAWVVDVKLFSNVSVCFSFEVPGGRLEQFQQALAATDLHFTNDSMDSLASPLDGDSAGSLDADIAGTLQITFVHNEPDLRIEVPRIPG